MPYAVFGTITMSTVLYILASLALVGMQTYHNIDTDSGFSEAFMAQGSRTWNAIGQITAIGELVALPLVVLISFMAQPRLLYAMAQDKLAPALFARANADGNLTESLLVSGAAFTILAAAIPFKYLENMVSAGILINFNLTNAAYILMRLHECREKQHGARISRYLPPGGGDGDSTTTRTSGLYFNVCQAGEMPWRLAWFNGLCIATSVCVVNSMFAASKTRAVPWACFGVFFLTMLYLCGHSIARVFKENGDSVTDAAGTEQPLRQDSSNTIDTDTIQATAEDAPFTLHAPWFPAIPLLGMLINWFLLAQLPLSGFAFLLGYFGLTMISYGTTFCCAGQSAGSRTVETSVDGPSHGSSNNLLWASVAQNEGDEARHSTLSASTHSMLHSEHIDVGINDSGGDEEEEEDVK